jgi:hypothetical protein
MDTAAKNALFANTLFLNPLDEADEAVLFWMLGDAWYAQLDPIPGEAYHLESSVNVGRREFETIMPLLTEALRAPFSNGVYSRVASTLQVETTWKMPVSVIVALARKRGIVHTGNRGAPA